MTDPIPAAAPADPVQEQSGMSERTYNFIDKSSWGNGPWQSEPDKVQWVDAETGLDCLAVRAGDMGHWCGYVGVPKGHPFFEVDEQDARLPGDEWVEVHGGLTYAAFCAEGRGEHGVCHVPFPGRPAHVWWLGFDCAHAGDVSPGSDSRLPVGLRRIPGDQYRTLDYVRSECQSLSRQLKAAAAS